MALGEGAAMAHDEGAATATPGTRRATRTPIPTERPSPSTSAMARLPAEGALTASF